MQPGPISSAVERLPYKQDVAGSKPASGIIRSRSQTEIWSSCSKRSGETAIRAGAAQNAMKPSQAGRISRSFPQREKWPPTASSCSVGSVVSLRPQTIDKDGRTVAEMFCNGRNVYLAMVSSGRAHPLRGPAATPTGSISAPAMAPLTWGLRPLRNSSGTACGPCLGGGSGRGIGAMAPALLPHRLPPRSQLRLDPPSLPRPLVAATAAGS